MPRRRRADIHRRAAKDDQLRADDDLAFLRDRRGYFPDPARRHDRMVAARLCVVCSLSLRKYGRVTGQRRALNSLLNAAPRTFGHDIQRAR